MVTRRGKWNDVLLLTNENRIETIMSMYMFETIIVIFLIAFLTPIVVFLAAKLGAFGYLRGKELFEESHKPKEGEE